MLRSGTHWKVVNTRRLSGTYEFGVFEDFSEDTTKTWLCIIVEVLKIVIQLLIFILTEMH